MDELLKVIASLETEEALAKITKVLETLLSELDDDARERFMMNLIGQSQGDKLSSLVQLWLAECMGEGVDPTQMCRSLVDKVAQSGQLSSITDPDLLMLFEDWFEELEQEVLALFKSHGYLDELQLASKLGMSVRGATFLISKLKREKKL